MASFRNVDGYEILRLEFERLQQELERSERERERSDRENERLRTESRLHCGEYFMTLDELWQRIPVQPLTGAEYDQLFRTWEQVNGISVYQKTVVRSKDHTRMAAENASLSSTSTDAAASVWTQDIFFASRPSADAAHLVPASKVNALTWFHVVSWVLGLRDDSYSYSKVAKAILGVCVPVSQSQAGNRRGKTRQRRGKTRQKTRQRRETSTGIKHLPQNKICLMQQAKFYDTRPCVLMIPVMTLQEAKDWNGHEYDAIVVVGEWEDASVQDVFRGIGMIGKVLLDKPRATDDDLLTATNLLNIVVQGMAYSLIEKADPLNSDVKAKWDKLKEDFITASSQTELLVARLKENRPQHKPVYKYTFQPHVHPPPDPILLAAKAATNWAKQQKFVLVAGGEYFDDEDGLDAEAERQYVEMLEQSYRAGSWEQLARGLHQQGHEILRDC